MGRLLALFCLIMLSSVPAAAQIASLVADQISVDPDGKLSASGNVEVFFEDARLTASEVVYDDSTKSLELVGPVVLTDASGSLVLADSARLDAERETALMEGARMILGDQLQLAAGQVRRVNERFTDLQPVVASTCVVCAKNPTPTWEIRASRVVYDETGRQLYFSNAQIRFLGVPIFYVPRMRLPDPTLERASGFLLPSLRSTTQLGTGLEFPYFRVINDYSDVTLTPYFSPKTATLRFDYRHNLPAGPMTFVGAVSSDDLAPGELRAYTFGQGSFALPRDFRLTFGLELVSDRAYLLEYDFSDKDRLESNITLSRTRRDDITAFSATAFRTLRARDLLVPNQLPDRVFEADYARKLPTSFLGGQAWARFDARYVGRPSEEDVFGRDVGRAGASVDWWRNWTLPHGLEATTEAALAVDVYNVSNDSSFDEVTDRAIPTLAATLRWPLRKTEKSGALSLLEPVAQVAWTEVYGGNVPNEDSRIVEFDEGNLFALSRFPGVDRYEEGLRANLGVSWSQIRRDGTRLGFTLGKVFRAKDLDQFSQGTGLTGRQSDWLTAFRIAMNDRFQFTNRALIGNDLSVTMNETRLAFTRGRNLLTSTYVWSVADIEEGRLEPLNELAFESVFGLDRNWFGRAELRYDFQNDRASRALAGLIYENECFAVDLSVSRRYTSSVVVDPTTTFQIRFRVSGFGDDAAENRARQACRG